MSEDGRFGALSRYGGERREAVRNPLTISVIKSKCGFLVLDFGGNSYEAFYCCFDVGGWTVGG